MPTWNLRYRIGFDCTLDEFNQEQQTFRSDPACLSYTSHSSNDMIEAQVTFMEGVTPTFQSSMALQNRTAEAVPMLPLLPSAILPRMEMEFELGSVTEPLQIGSVACIDSQGRIGREGVPIGVIYRVDHYNNRVRVITQDSRGDFENMLQVSRIAWGSNGTAYIEPDHHRPVQNPRPMPDNFIRARQEIAAEEDDRVLRLLDSISPDFIARVAQALQPPEKKEGPRPVFKSRYQRIREGFEK